MTPEEKALLENTHALVKENNEILRKLQRSARFTLAWKIFYWVLIIGLSFGAFHFFQSYLSVLTGINGNADKSDNVAQQIQELIR